MSATKSNASSRSNILSFSSQDDQDKNFNYSQFKTLIQKVQSFLGMNTNNIGELCTQLQKIINNTKQDDRIANRARELMQQFQQLKNNNQSIKFFAEKISKHLSNQQKPKNQGVQQVSNRQQNNKHSSKKQKPIWQKNEGEIQKRNRSIENKVAQITQQLKKIKQKLMDISSDKNQEEIKIISQEKNQDQQQAYILTPDGQWVAQSSAPIVIHSNYESNYEIRAQHQQLKDSNKMLSQKTYKQTAQQKNNDSQGSQNFQKEPIIEVKDKNQDALNFSEEETKTKQGINCQNEKEIKQPKEEYIQKIENRNSILRPYLQLLKRQIQAVGKAIELQQLQSKQYQKVTLKNNRYSELQKLDQIVQNESIHMKTDLLSNNSEYQRNSDLFCISRDTDKLAYIPQNEDKSLSINFTKNTKTNIASPKQIDKQKQDIKQNILQQQLNGCSFEQYMEQKKQNQIQLEINKRIENIFQHLKQVTSKTDLAGIHKVSCPSIQIQNQSHNFNNQKAIQSNLQTKLSLFSKDSVSPHYDMKTNQLLKKQIPFSLFNPLRFIETSKTIQPNVSKQRISSDFSQSNANNIISPKYIDNNALISNVQIQMPGKQNSLQKVSTPISPNNHFINKQKGFINQNNASQQNHRILYFQTSKPQLKIIRTQKSPQVRSLNKNLYIPQQNRNTPYKLIPCTNKQLPLYRENANNLSIKENLRQASKRQHSNRLMQISKNNGADNLQSPIIYGKLHEKYLTKVKSAETIVYDRNKMQSSLVHPYLPEYSHKNYNYSREIARRSTSHSYKNKHSKGIQLTSQARQRYSFRKY